MPTLGVIKLMLENGLLALNLVLMLLNENELFVFHVLEFVFEGAQLALFVLHLLCRVFHIRIELLLSIDCHC